MTRLQQARLWRQRGGFRVAAVCVSVVKWVAHFILKWQKMRNIGSI